MPNRNFDDWLTAYVEYVSFTEAPKRMHFWCGVSALAGTLQRKVWFDQGYFKWYTNHYILLVAPPGVVSKSTTASLAIDLLRKVPGIGFGPDIVTWPALVSAFANSTSLFEYKNQKLVQSALTLHSSELGNLINPEDREMVDLLVDLWDSRQIVFRKVTKTSGNDSIENPWINIIACTTPSWIAGYFPEYMISGGLTSRFIFVYADKKDKLSAYPYKTIPKGVEERRQALIEDLEYIGKTLIGSYRLEPEAEKWGEDWYAQHNKNPSFLLANDNKFGGYLARKQTHIHKLAMIIAASCRDDLVLTLEDMILAHRMVTDLETEMPMIFAKMGRTEESVQAERFIKFIQAQPKEISFEEAYRYVHVHFPKLRDFETVLAGAVRSGQVIMCTTPQGVFLRGPTLRLPGSPG